jgi:hypothetical protein
MAKSNKNKPAARAVAKTRAPAEAVAEVDVVEERKPAGMEAGIAIMTTLALIGAILVIDYCLSGYGGAMFFS